MVSIVEKHCDKYAPPGLYSGEKPDERRILWYSDIFSILYREPDVLRAYKELNVTPDNETQYCNFMAVDIAQIKKEGIVMGLKRETQVEGEKARLLDVKT